jgi:multisubunit Na+/H+ antiporter MnhF subunit
MSNKKHDHDFPEIPLPARFRQLLLLGAVFCFAAPNGYFLYRYMKEPQLMDQLFANPLGVCFLSETALLVVLFLVAVWYFKQSLLKVLYYALAAFVGGLTFALPLFLWFNSYDRKRE